MDSYLKVRHAHFEEGLSGRQIARDFGISRDRVAKMLAYSEPPGYRRTARIKRPKLDPYTGQIDQWLAEDKARPRKQRHTAKRIFERLCAECGFDGGYTIVKALRLFVESSFIGNIPRAPKARQGIGGSGLRRGALKVMCGPASAGHGRCLCR